MNLRDYIAQKFQSFGINLSEADLLDVVIASGIAEDAEIGKGNIHAVSVGIAKFVPELMIRATSISEN